MTDLERIVELEKLLKHTENQRDGALMKLGFSEEEIRVVGMRPGPDGKGVVVEVAHHALETFAIAMCDSFINGGATNYFVVGVEDPRTREQYEVTMQKRTGKTPIVLHQEAKVRIAELENRIIELENGTNDKQ